MTTVTSEPATDPEPEADADPGPQRRWTWAQHGFLALVSFASMLTTAPGWVAADTKAYLYLDPGRLLSRAWSLWDPNVALGTVTHQNIGYLWPMGPWFWAFDRLGVPMWVAQRLWMATLLYVAGLGVLYLVKVLGWGRAQPAAALAAAAIYAFSPYVLDYGARISVLLLPWAGLPWLIALTHRSLRSRSWRYPALFALVVATIGGTNATSLLLVGLGPLLWVVFDIWLHRDVRFADALRAVLKIGLLSLLVSLWWIAGLVVQGGWGLDVLAYTETVETVARSSLASEVLRGLGYWFFYGTDKLGPWIEPGRTFTETPALIAIGFVAPVLAMVGLATTRWRYRVNTVALILVGTVVAVGAYPYRDPSPLGAVFKSVANSSSVGLALRSTARAVPLVCLGIALAIGAGLAALAARRPRLGLLAALAVVGLALLANPPLWTGGFVGKNLRRPEDVPSYWTAALKALDQEGSATRVLEVPGSDFAAYRWGNTVDPISPGLMDRPMVARELIPFGSAPSADLVNSFDEQLQTGVLDPASIVPVARLMGAGDLLVRNDLEYERYRVVRPKQVSQLLAAVPTGLGPARGFGAPVPNLASPSLPMHDEIYLGTRSVPDPAPVTVLPVQNPLPIVRTRSADAPTILDGSGDGVVDAGGAGLLDSDSVLVYAAALADRPDILRQTLASGPQLIVTDTNRKRATRWGTVRDNQGYTESADETPLAHDPSDNRLPVFPNAGVDSQTTMEQQGVARIQATAYGNPVTYTPADRPSQALDGDPSTAWAVGALGPVGGQRLLIQAEGPVTTDHIDLQQARLGYRVITRLGVVLDGKQVGDFDLGATSFDPGGQRISLGGSRTFTTLELVIRGDNVGRLARYDSQNGVGIAEVGVAGLRVHEVVRLPTDLLTAAGTSSLDDRLTFLLSRLRANPSEPFASDEERSMTRELTLPTARTFGVSGEAHLDAAAPDDRLDDLLGTHVSGVSGVSGVTAARSSSRLPGLLSARASSAVDGDLNTAWTNHFGDQVGDWLEVALAAPRSIDQLDLVVVADGEHSVPTRLRITSDTGTDATVDVPPIADGKGTVEVPLHFTPLQGTTFQVTLEAVRAVVTTNWFGGGPITMPVSIAELGLAPLPTPTPTTAVASPVADFGACRDDLLSVDGRPVWLQVGGSSSTAGQLGALTVATCGPDADGLTFGAGVHDLQSAPGTGAGIDIDRLVLSSAPGGAAGAAPSTSPNGPTAASSVKVDVVSQGRTSMHLRVTGRAGPVWLVVGQSWSKGWKATADGRSLGEPVVVDGYANGWLVDPGPDGVIDVSVDWTPQRLVMAGLGSSALGVLLCVALVLVAGRRRRSISVVALASAAAPRLRMGVGRSGPPPGWLRTLMASLLTGALAGAAITPLVGVVVAVLAVLALRLPRGRIIPAVGAAGGVALAAAFTVAKELRNAYPADFGWTDFFRPAHLLAAGGLALLALLLVVDRMRGGPDEPVAEPAPTGSAPEPTTQL